MRDDYWFHVPLTQDNVATGQSVPDWSALSPDQKRGLVGDGNEGAVGKEKESDLNDEEESTVDTDEHHRRLTTYKGYTCGDMDEHKKSFEHLGDPQRLSQCAKTSNHNEDFPDQNEVG